MDFVRTLKTIYRMDEHLVGQRAVDLATLAEKGYATPLCFVVTNEAFETFVLKNKLQVKIGAALQGSDAKAMYDQVREIILSAPVPEEIIEQLRDAYESLSMDAEASVQHLIATKKLPIVNIYLSPNYTLPETTEGMILNVKGEEPLLLALRECWACLFTPAMRRHRRESEIGDRNLNTGIIIQRITENDATAEAWSGEGDEITVKTYFGAPDVGLGLGKDEWRLSKEYLKPVYQSVGVQREMLARDEEDRLDKVSIGERGERQKVSDREIIEIARLAKKAAILLERPAKLLLDVKGEAMKLLLCNRLSSGKQYEAEEMIDEHPLFNGTVRSTPPEKSADEEQDFILDDVKPDDNGAV